MTTIQLRLDEARRCLLDLSRRNRLLNFRPRGRRSIHIVDELPEEVYQSLAAADEFLQVVGGAVRRERR